MFHSLFFIPCPAVAKNQSSRQAEKAGLTPILLEPSVITFEEAKLALECRKLYRTEFNPDNFLAAHIILSCYPERDFHYVYICEILSIYTKG